MGIFAPHASQFGFFLNGALLVKSLFPGSGQRDEHLPAPSPKLMNTVFLFGIHLSNIDAFKAREAAFLSRALAESTNIGHQPHQILQSIQSEVLLAHYFVRHGRFLEAMHRLNSAISLVIGSRLYVQPDIGPLTAMSTRQSIEFGERVDALWSVFALYKCWSISLQWPTTIAKTLEEQIDLPWPLDPDSYEAVSFLNLAKLLL
jgi:hypothetical protein